MVKGDNAPQKNKITIKGLLTNSGTGFVNNTHHETKVRSRAKQTQGGGCELTVRIIREHEVDHSKGCTAKKPPTGVASENKRTAKKKTHFLSVPQKSPPFYKRSESYRKKKNIFQAHRKKKKHFYRGSGVFFFCGTKPTLGFFFAVHPLEPT